MSRYATADEQNIRMHPRVLDWRRAGLLDESQMQSINTDLRVELRRTNVFLRAVLFVFTLVIVAASIALFGQTLDIDDKGPVILTCLIAAILSYGAAEFLIEHFRLYRFGVEEALAISAALLLTIAAIVLMDQKQPAVRVGVIVLGVAGIALYWRFGYLYAAVASLICTAAIPFQFNIRPEMQRAITAALLLAIFAIARRGRMMHGDDFPGDDYGVLQACAAAGVYLSCNVQLIDVLGPGRFYWFTYGLIWILPVVGLWWAFRDRDRLLLDVSLLMALATLVTNKSYLHLTRQSLDPILFGVFLIATALVIKRRLSSGPEGRRYGFTASRLLTGDRRVFTVVGTASAVLQSDVAVRGTHQSKPEFGGGRSGGAGASGSF
jgi:hypothetical protein